MPPQARAGGEAREIRSGEGAIEREADAQEDLQGGVGGRAMRIRHAWSCGDARTHAHD